MIGDVSMRAPTLAKTARPERRSLATWQRRAIEVVVAALAFGVWGQLAYSGALRLLARFEGVTLSGSVLIDLMSLGIGVAGSLAGVSALWALGMRVIGRTPSSLLGAPDDGPIDTAYRLSHAADLQRPDATPRG